MPKFATEQINRTKIGEAMNKRSKLLVPGLIFALGSTSILLTVASCRQQEEASPCCEPKPCCVPTCCPEIVEDCCAVNVCPPTCMVTPNASPRVRDGIDLFVTADFIYWNVREANLEYALSAVDQTAIGASFAGTLNPGNIYAPRNKWEPGFKVGLGYNFCHDGWDIYGEYTWLNTNISNSTPVFSSSGNPGLYDAYWFINTPLNPDTQGFEGGVAIGMLSSASAKWHMNFDVVDLELGRSFYTSPRLTLRPHFGLKGTWQKQTMNVDFFDLLGNNTSTHNGMKNWGIGVRGGLDTAWHFTREFSLIGDFSLTGLWEKLKVKRKDNTFTLGAAIPNISYVNISNNYSTVEPILEWMLGLRYEFWTCGDDFHFAFDAAWEVQNWFEQNQFIRMPGCVVTNSGNLTLQGLTAKVRFDF